MNTLAIVSMVTLVAACVVIHEQRIHKLEKDCEWMQGIIGKEVTKEATSG